MALTSLSIGALTSPVGSRDALARARQRATLVPELLVDAKRIANTVTTGWHGRRKRGSGDSFWQFRPYDTGESMTRIDWRRSARDDSITVRDQEWEAAHTVWVWADNSASMLYQSDKAGVSKQSRALVLALAMAELLARSGERVGWPGLTRALSARQAAERIAQEMILSPIAEATFPDTRGVGGRSDLIVISDFLEPVDDIKARIDDIARRQIRGTLVHIADPAEHAFPFAGRTRFSDPETGVNLTIGRAESVQESYQRAFAARRRTLDEYCRRIGWNYIPHTTDQLASTALVAMHTRLSGAL